MSYRRVIDDCPTRLLFKATETLPGLERGLPCNSPSQSIKATYSILLMVTGFRYSHKNSISL